MEIPVTLDYDTNENIFIQQKPNQMASTKNSSIKYIQLVIYLISLLQIASGVSNSPRKISENFSGS